MLFMNRCLHFHIRSPHPNPSLLLRKQYLSLREQCLSQRERGLNAVGLRAFLANPTYILGKIQAITALSNCSYIALFLRVGI